MMKRKLLLLSLTLVLAFSGVVFAAGVNGQWKGKDIVKVTYEGREVKPDSVPGYIDGANTMVPLGMLRKMGVTVQWDQSTLTANVKLPSRTVPVLIQSQLDELSKYVYKVLAPLPDDPSKSHQGSGFIVDGYLITNAHVAGDSPYAQVEIDGSKQKISEYAFVNKEVDLMGFKVTGGKSLPVSAELPQVGDPVYAVGFPHGKLNITEGQVYGITQGPNDITQIVNTARTEPGNSGSFLLNGKGQIVGVNATVMSAGGTDTSFAIPIKYVDDELNKLK